MRQSGGVSRTADNNLPGILARSVGPVGAIGAAAGICFALASATASAAPQGPWVLPVGDLLAPGEDAYEPKVTTAPDGTTTAAWPRFNGSNTIIQAAIRPPGGIFGTPTDLSASGEDASNPQITTAGDGSTTALWTRYNGSNNIVQFASTAQPSPLLEVNRQGSGTGTVSSSPAGINCGADCAENYLSFTTVTLTATPASGSTFEGWRGGCEGSVSDTCELTLLEDQNVTAAFEAVPPGKAKLAELKIKPKSKAVRAGKKVTFRVKVKNTGDATARSLKLCAKGPKKLVKVPRCQKPGNLEVGRSKAVKLKVAVRKGARKGKKAKITFTVTAGGGLKKTGKATIRVR